MAFDAIQQSHHLASILHSTLMMQGILQSSANVCKIDLSILQADGQGKEKAPEGAPYWEQIGRLAALEVAHLYFI
ncbi:hypothetical protein GCM10010837_03540 [Aminobacter niigataensis]